MKENFAIKLRELRKASAMTMKMMMTMKMTMKKMMTAAASL